MEYLNIIFIYTIFIFLDIGAYAAELETIDEDDENASTVNSVLSSYSELYESDSSPSSMTAFDDPLTGEKHWCDFDYKNLPNLDVDKSFPKAPNGEYDYTAPVTLFFRSEKPDELSEVCIPNFFDSSSSDEDREYHKAWVQFPVPLLPYLAGVDFSDKVTPFIWAKFILPKTVYQQYMEDDEETDQDFFEVSSLITNPAQYIDAEEVEEDLDDEG